MKSLVIDFWFPVQRHADQQQETVGQKLSSLALHVQNQSKYQIANGIRGKNQHFLWKRETLYKASHLFFCCLFIVILENYYNFLNRWQWKEARILQEIVACRIRFRHKCRFIYGFTIILMEHSTTCKPAEYVYLKKSCIFDYEGESSNLLGPSCIISCISYPRNACISYPRNAYDKTKQEEVLLPCLQIKVYPNNVKKKKKKNLLDATA